MVVLSDKVIVRKGGMALEIDPLKQHVLLEEVFLQGCLCLQHFDEIVGLVNDPETRQTRIVWAHAHAFLTHSAMMSKLLKSPQRRVPLAQQRSQFLSELLEVPEDSAIFDRNARNNIEHQDERLDLWIEQDGGSLIEIVFFNRAGFDFLARPNDPEGRRKFIRRALILDELIFVTQGREGYEFTPIGLIAEEVKRITELADNKLQESEIRIVHPN